MAFAALVLRRQHADFFPCQAEIVARQQIGAFHRQGVAGAEDHAALRTAHHAARAAAGHAVVSGFHALLAVAAAHPAGAGEAAFLLLILVIFLTELFRRGQGQIAACGEENVLRARHAAAGKRHVASGLHRHAVAAEPAGDRALLLHVIVGGDGF